MVKPVQGEIRSCAHSHANGGSFGCLVADSTNKGVLWSSPRVPVSCLLILDTLASLVGRSKHPSWPVNFNSPPAIERSNWNPDFATNLFGNARVRDFAMHN